MPNKELHFLYVIAIFVLLFFGMLIYSVDARNTAKDKALAEAVHFALEKGIEPLAVTCAYELDKEPSPLCVMYVNKSQATNDISVQVTKK